ncbi:MAG: KpsF/GutQ family sugar-phosphate isomerase [Bacteroidales bacterium]|nr:KpsF/GutQ family sugar-phosphate isomerase [Bacteroidales bacterium]
MIDIAKQIIKQESQSITNLIQYVDDDFAKVVELIFYSKGRVIITGIGKSANIANKIVATLNSTGTPAIFMHAADAIHGDLGIILEDDIVICISKSGNTPEIKVLVPLIKNLGNKIIALVSTTDSFLANNADHILKATVKKEACPNNLVPTTSTTTQLVLGDALAICLLQCRGFTSDDFGRIHPGGSIGKKIYMRVSDLYKNNEAPSVYINDKIDKIIIEISSKRLGATAVLDNNNNLVGVVTDGDLRRMLGKNINIEQLIAKDIMSVNPKTVDKDLHALKAFNIMEDNKITQLIVTDNNKYIGMIHLHDILREGIV